MEANISRHFTHITIPAEIWLRRDLSMQAKALWAELRSLHDPKEGGCYASDEYLMEFLNLKRSRLHELFKELKDRSLMEVVSFNGRRIVRKAIVPIVEYTTGQQLSGKPDTCLPENRIPDMRNSGYLPTPSPYIHKSKEKNKDKNIAQTAHTAPPIREKKEDISFSFDSNEFLNISDQDLSAWKEIYSSIDIEIELKEIRQWILSNPSKVKGRKLWRKLITGWLKKSHETATRRVAYKQISQAQPVDRHRGFQKDTRPGNPNRVKDYSQWQPDGTIPAPDLT
jgi:hypothetical protein